MRKRISWLHTSPPPSYPLPVQYKWRQKSLNHKKPLLSHHVYYHRVSQAFSHRSRRSSAQLCWYRNGTSHQLVTHTFTLTHFFSKEYICNVLRVLLAIKKTHNVTLHSTSARLWYPYLPSRTAVTTGSGGRNFKHTGFPRPPFTWEIERSSKAYFVVVAALEETHLYLVRLVLPPDRSSANRIHS
jgi:hypothetical protein